MCSSDLVTGTATAWPVVAAACALLALVGAVLALLTARRAPSTGSRFEVPDRPAAAPLAGPAGTAAPDRAGDWDALSRGDDPTG